MIWILSLISMLLIFLVCRNKEKKKKVAWSEPRILMYHMVREHIPNAKFNKLRVKPTEFEKQIEWMQDQGFHFVTMQELQNNWGKHPDKTVAITFDDGYLDNLENAYPVLEKYQAKATIYVVVDRHDRDWSTYKKSHHNSGELMLEPKLNDEQVKTLALSGLVEIGSHTITHANLDKLNDKQCFMELLESKKQLEQLIHQPVESFAYPFGIYSQRDADFAKQAGYKTAVTTKEGIDIVNCDFFQLQRIKISGKDSIRTVKHRLEYGVK